MGLLKRTPSTVADLEAALATTPLPPAEQRAVLEENSDARLVGLRTSLTVLAALAALALFLTRLLPTRPAGVVPEASSAGRP